MTRVTFAYLLIACFLATGCSKVPPTDDGVVSCTIANKIDGQVEWRQGCCPNEQMQCFISSAVSHELTADEAIQIALLNNPRVQAIFEELGIAQANLVEAGLLSNPSFEIEIRYPHVRWLKTNIEYLLITSVLDIFLIPLRTKLAASEYEQTKLMVSNEILDLAFEVRQTYYELIAERKKIQNLQLIVELTSILSEISSKQKAIGNINTLEFQMVENRFLEAMLELSRSQAEVIHLREKLNRLLGFTADICLSFPEDMPQTIYCGFDLCTLESIALENRLDLQVAQFEIIRLSQMLGLKDWWTYTNLQAGLAGERDPDGQNLLGFGLSGQVPIFNYGQAARMRLFAQLRQAQDRFAELRIRILSEVREAHTLLISYSRIINDYQDRLLPLQANISASSEELYNVMGLGVDTLLENKRLEIVATQHYIENLKQYLVARVALDKSLGGYLFKLISQMECME